MTMTYKRNISRLPIPPQNATVQNAVCHYCIVGCGYKAITWELHKDGGPHPDRNIFGVDLSVQQGEFAKAWFSPSMYNVVKKDGRNVNLVLMPDDDCEVNSGLGSTRGARMAEDSYSEVHKTQLNRLTTPLVYRHGELFEASWDEAFWLTAEVTRRVVEQYGEDGLIVSAYDHGGMGGGYENTWATGKLYFESMKVKNIRIHNRPAYNSEVHATRDMGVGELNNCYEDAELADTIMAVGTNAMETQTNYFLNHWVPNMDGGSLAKKQSLFPGESHPPCKIIIVDPRRTVTVNACEFEAGKDNVLHLALKTGTDLVLFNAIMTEIAAKGWIDRNFIGSHTKGFNAMLAANKVSIDEAARVTGLTPAQIRKAAEWVAKPKDGGARRRTMFAYEKGLIWGNDNYRTNGALVNIALATGNIGRPGGGCVRMGGHQEGYVRPSDAHVGRPAAYVDQLLINGKGGVHHVWGCDHYKTTLNASEFKRVYKRRTDLVKEAMDRVPYGDRWKTVEAIMNAIARGGLFVIDVDIVPTKIGEQAHVILPAATQGEMNLTSMNGERRMRLSERYMDPPGDAKPDCLIVAGLAQALEKGWRARGNTAVADRFKGYDWLTEEDAFMDGYHQHADGGQFVTYPALRQMGTNGFQEPATGFAAGQIIGTKRLYADGKFHTPDGKALFMATQWRGLQTPGKQQESKAYPFLINNGRANRQWQSMFLDQYNTFVMERASLPIIEINPDDLHELGAKAGDLVEVYNQNGSVQAIAYPTPTAKRKESFFVFAHPKGPVGNVVSKGVNELVIPNYKQTWGNIRKIAGLPKAAQNMSFKSLEYRT
jgi:arsenite oxidase large subunit